MVMAMLFAVLGTGFMQAATASNGRCGENRHFKTKQLVCHSDKNGNMDCSGPKTICVWNKGYGHRKSRKNKNAPVVTVSDMPVQTEFADEASLEDGLASA